MFDCADDAIKTFPCHQLKTTQTSEKTMLRRAALKALLGGTVTTGLSIANLKSIGVTEAELPQDPTETFESDGGLDFDSNDYDPIWDHLDEFERRYIYRANNPVASFPAHIANKKSWSHVFKSSEFFKEEAEAREIVKRIRLNDSLRKKVMNVLKIS